MQESRSRFFFWRKSNFWYRESYCHWWHLNRSMCFCHSYGICMHRAQENPEDKLLQFRDGDLILLDFIPANKCWENAQNQSKSLSHLIFPGFCCCCCFGVLSVFLFGLFCLLVFLSYLYSQAQQGHSCLTKQACKHPLGVSQEAASISLKTYF